MNRPRPIPDDKVKRLLSAWDGGEMSIHQLARTYRLADERVAALIYEALAAGTVTRVPRASKLVVRCTWCDRASATLLSSEGDRICAVCGAARAPVSEPH